MRMHSSRSSWGRRQLTFGGQPNERFVAAPAVAVVQMPLQLTSSPIRWQLEWAAVLGRFHASASLLLPSQAEEGSFDPFPALSHNSILLLVLRGVILIVSQDYLILSPASVAKDSS